MNAMASEKSFSPEEQAQISQALAEFGVPDEPMAPPAPAEEAPAPSAAAQPEPPSKPKRRLPWLPAAIFFVLCFCAAIVIALLPKEKEEPLSLYSPSNYRQTLDAGIAVTADGKAVCDTIAYQGDLQSWTDVIAVSASDSRLYALKSDGTVLMRGGTDQFQNTIAGWHDIIAIDAGGHYLAALRSDGTVVVASDYPELDYGATETGDWTDIVAISAGSYHVVGLKADGTVVSTQIQYPKDSDDPTGVLLLSLDRGQTDVHSWSDIVAVSAGHQHTVGLRADGTVVAVGAGLDQQCNVAHWQNIVAVSAGSFHTLGLKADGTVVAAGDELLSTACNVSYFSDVVAIAAGAEESYVLTKDGTVYTTVYRWSSGKHYEYAASFVNIRSPFIKEKSSG